MIPYASFTYFGVLLYPVLPTLALRMRNRIPWWWVALVSAAMLVAQYSGSVVIWPGTASLRELWLVVGFAILQWVTAWLFLGLRARNGNPWPFYGAVGLTLVPLVAARLVPAVAPGSQLGFIGLSYLTFRALDVIFCIRDKAVLSVPPLQYAVFLLFFPTISSGPIDRYRRFAHDWSRPRDRAAFIEDVDGAVHRIFTGLLYKFVLAALIKQYWLDLAATGQGPLALVSYAYAYTLYLFFDFAGYTAFAIGMSYLFGVHTPENFNRPFLARDIRDFWGRWHMSLSAWFRDHVYMRFLLAATRGRWFRGRHTASYVGLALSFGLMGVWHGTEVRYLLYGAYHAALLIGFDLFERWNKTHAVWGDGPVWRTVGIVVTFHVVCAGFLLFSGRLG